MDMRHTSAVHQRNILLGGARARATHNEPFIDRKKYVFVGFTELELPEYGEAIFWDRDGNALTSGSFLLGSHFGCG